MVNTFISSIGCIFRKNSKIKLPKNYRRKNLGKIGDENMIGRIEELSLLESKYKSDRFEFGIVYGSRRIGKTTILDEFKKRTDGLMFEPPMT